MVQEKQFISLSDDLLFKEAMTHIDNWDILIDFLATMTDFKKEYLESTKIEVAYESVLKKTKYTDKNFKSDVIIKFDNYEINLECYSRFNDRWFNKSTSYIMRIFSTQMNKGKKDYDLLEGIIQINLIDNVKGELTQNEIVSEYGLVNIDDLKDRKLADKFIMKYFPA